MPFLRVIYRSSVNAGRELALDAPIVRIGRDPSCHVSFDENADRMVSRLHAEIRWDHSGPVLFPNSGRVVLLHHERLSGPTPLSPGDILELAGPGGPSFEVQFEGKARTVIGAATDVDPSARTLFEIPAMRAEAPLSPATDIEQTLAPNQLPLVAPRTPAEPPVPREPAAPHERPAPHASADEPLPFGRIRLLIAFAFATVTAASLALAWSAMRTKPQPRPATPAPAHAGVTKPAAIVTAPRTAGASSAASTASDTAPAASPPDPAVRHAYAVMRRAQLILAGSANAPAAARNALAEQARTAELAYQAALKEKHLDTVTDETMRLIRATARRLGECDGAMPLGFVTEAAKALDGFPEDADAVKQLTEAVHLGQKSGTLRSITSALSAEALPPELVLIPLRESGFRSDDVSMPEAGMVAKGMWQLVPAAAQRFGFQMGAHAAELTIDPGDERLQFPLESQKAAKGLASVFQGPAAGSALLLLATWDHGQDALLSELRKEAGLKPDETDPERVSFWRLYESGAVSDAIRQRALAAFTLAAVLAKPSQFDLPLEPLFPTVRSAR